VLVACQFGPTCGVKTALCAGLTELSFSQTVFPIGDKPGLFKGKSSFFSFFLIKNRLKALMALQLPPLPEL
jgi:hypothetical protein